MLFNITTQRHLAAIRSIGISAQPHLRIAADPRDRHPILLQTGQAFQVRL
jgi:hypothetical protein